MNNGIRDVDDGIHNAVEVPPSPHALRLEAAIAAGWPDVADVLRDLAGPGGDGGGGPEMAALLTIVQQPTPDAATLRRAARAALDEHEAARPLNATASWAADVTARPWLVDGWAAQGRAALLTGDGGRGKSRLALQLAASVCLGRPDFLSGGPRIDGGRATALIATWEDEADEVRRRLAYFLGGDRGQLDGRLHVLDMADRGPLWGPDVGRHVSTTSGLTQAGRLLRAYAARVGARLLVIDPLAAAYASDENVRGLVRAYVGSWDAWARSTGCTVLTVAHPPKGGATFSGSTDWQAAHRAVWTLAHETPNGKAAPIASALALTCEKTNYGQQPARVWLAQDTGGVFSVTPAPTWAADATQGPFPR